MATPQNAIPTRARTAPPKQNNQGLPHPFSSKKKLVSTAQEITPMQKQENPSQLNPPLVQGPQTTSFGFVPYE